ncbi:MAG: polymer-forming cytoskeletal protein [Flavobacteriaceae bacterium]
MAENKFFSSPSVDVIEASTKIVGDIVSKADFRIDGIVEGNITTTGKVVIGKSGKISGKLNCSNADVSGSISGHIQISETLSLMSESYIQGDITTAKLSVEEGAQVDATIVMKTGKQLKAVESDSANEKKPEAEKTA